MPILRGVPRLHLLGFIAPLALVVVLAAASAFSALEAGRRQRTAALRTVRDYADFAAFSLANVALQELERRLTYGFFPVLRYDPSSGEPLPPPSALGLDRVEAGRCVKADTLPTYVRLDTRSGDLQLSGGPLLPAAMPWLADTLRATAASWERDMLYGHIFAAGERPPLLAYRVVQDSTGQTLAVYAKTSCLTLQDGLSLFRLAATTTRLLPPSLTGSLPNDSLLSVRAIDPLGRVVWSTPVQYASGTAGAWDGGARIGGLRLEVAIRPEAASRLVIGGVPPSRFPLAAALLVLTLVFSALAVLQLRQQQRMVQARARFISNVSHELRTPLQQILVFTELQRMDKLRTEPEREHALEVVERETRRLIELVDNVLHFARGVRGENGLALTPIDLEPIVRETVQSFLPLARTRNATLDVDCAPTVALGDARAVRRVLVNLLDNAVKYGPPGQTVRVRLSSANGLTSLAVEDQGPGIPDADRERVFQPFERLEREERAAIAGSGMGLAIVRDLVTRMHGSVTLEADTAGGARFVVHLPSAESAA
jgi:signal transduction histidine kinase